MVTQRDIECAEKCLNEIRFVRNESPAINGIAKLIAAHVAQETRELREAKDGAYAERNHLVAALSKLFPAGIKRTEIEGWDKDWENCIYIDLPTGQASWHIHDSEIGQFSHLIPYHGTYDGHDTPEKYRRLAALANTAKGEV